MLREKAVLLGWVTVVQDLVLVYAGFLSSKALHCHRYRLPLKMTGDDALTALVLSATVVFCLYIFRVYESMRKKQTQTIFKEVAGANLLAFGLFLAAHFFLKMDQTSRQLVTVFFLLSFGLVTLRIMVMRDILHWLRSKGYNYRNIVIVGDNQMGRNLAKSIDDYKKLGLRVMGFLADDEESQGRLAYRTRHRVIGTFADLDFLLKTNPIDEVVFATSEDCMSWKEMQRMLYICEEYGVTASILPRFFDMRLSKIEIQTLGELKLVTFSTSSRTLLPNLAKYAIDYGVAAFGLVILAPLLFVLAVAIKLDSQGPVFFRQRRCGLNGRQFNMLKFRSMCVDAEKRKHALAEMNEMSGPIFKIKYDPRITRVGRWMRKYSLDELPQLINVIRGEMSLVGPRPPLPSEVQKYERWQRRRLSVKPGLTCLWQVSGRNKIGFDEWMRLDLQYIDNWSLKNDIGLILKTIPTVLRGSGV